MADLTRIQKQVLNSVSEHSDSGGLSANYYYYMYCCEGRTDVQSVEAFEELLQELRDEGLLVCRGKNDKGEDLYALKNEEERVVSSQRGAAFSAFQAEFIGASQAKLSDIAKKAMMSFVPTKGIKDSGRFIQPLLLAASIGTEGKKPLNPPEKAMVNATFGMLLSNSMDRIYEMIELPVDEQAFGMMTVLCNVNGREAGRNLLRFILAFAYADGDLSDEFAQKLERVFLPVLGDAEK